jgi:hypothetical protein
VDCFVDRLDSVAVNDPLPEELTLTELILRIKDIGILQPSSTTLIHRCVRPTNGGDNSNSRQHRPPPSSDSRLSRPPQPVHSVFVDDGVTLLKISNSWPCIFFS